MSEHLKSDLPQTENVSFWMPSVNIRSRLANVCLRHPFHRCGDPGYRTPGFLRFPRKVVGPSNRHENRVTRLDDPKGGHSVTRAGSLQFAALLTGNWALVAERG